MNVTTKTVEYYGKPCLEFRNGSGKPFSLGPYKLRMILTAFPDVRDWLIEQGETVPVVAINSAPSEAPMATLEELSNVADAAVVKLESRVTTLEETMAVIIEEITRAATTMDNGSSSRQMQID